MIETAENLLTARVTVHYSGKAPVLHGVALDIAPGEIVGLVGQSGSGKSTLALAILGLLSRKRATIEGSIVFHGADLLKMRERDLRGLRGRALSLVLQSPLASLNPALRIRTQLKEAWRAHAGRASNCEAAIQSAMSSVSLPSDTAFLRKYPAQLSVGPAERGTSAASVDRDGSDAPTSPVGCGRSDQRSRRDYAVRNFGTFCQTEPRNRHVNSLHLARPTLGRGHLRTHRDSSRRRDCRVRAD